MGALKNLGQTYKRILIVQSVWHDRMNKIIKNFENLFTEVIDTYLFIPAYNGALCESISSFVE